MSPTDHALPRVAVAVAGGSIGGLCAGIALRGYGADVDIYERHAGSVETRGAGIVVQDELTGLLRRHGAPPLPTTSCRVRRYLEPAGGNGSAQAMPQRFTSWEAIYRTLQATFPEPHYHTGAAIQGFETGGGAVRADVEGRGTVEADLIVVADGAQSETRRRLLPDVAPHYAGYVAWRGTLDEADAPTGLAASFDGAFTFSEARSGGHILAYLIPGANADVAPGRRRLNWVWYTHADDADLDRLLTDRDGRRHRSSLPQGGAAEGVVTALRDTARREVHPRLAELVAATPDPFIQTIVDVVVPRTVFGRACLLGDAAFVVRPHTAAAAAKAAGEATRLADALRRAPADVDAALASWQGGQLRAGRELTRYGVALGDRWAAARTAPNEQCDRTP